MLKLIALAAAATFVIAAPASASEVRVPTAGKSISQLNTEVTAAARAVCKRDTAADTIGISAYNACYRASLVAAKIQVEQFAAAEGHKFAQR